MKYFFAVLMLFIVPITSHADGEKIFISPDDTLYALVIPVGNKISEVSESRIEMRTGDGKFVLGKDYSSTDGSHGWVLDNVSWTPDSNFFVYNMHSSGGHQPWHAPIDFFSRRDNKVLSLDEYVGTVTDPNFQVVAPDVVKVIIQKSAGAANTEIAVSLSMLMQMMKNNPEYNEANAGSSDKNVACVAPDAGQLTDWRKRLLYESAKLKAAIQKGIDFSPDPFIAFPEEGATETQLGENLSNLLIAAFNLNIVRPIAGTKTPRRVSEGVSDLEAKGSIEDIKASKKYIEELLTNIHGELCKGWNAELAIEEIKLKASREFWDSELRRLIKSFKRD